ncbi:MAG: DUF748 domain-containing protein [Candidatus Methylomirabilales bacterium]
MTKPRARMWGLIGLVALVAIIVGGILAFRTAVGVLKGKVVEALGPGSEIKELNVGWSGVEVEGLRIKGRPGWPAKDALRAERVVIVPSLLSLLSGKVRVGSITINRPYVSALRTRDGRLQIVPSLLTQRDTKSEAPGKATNGASAPTVTLSRITLKDGVVELFDATVARPPLKIRMEQIQASVRNVVTPTLEGKTQFDITGVVKGVQQDGRATVSGWAEVVSKDSSVNLRLRSVDLVAFQPYLSKAAETRLRKGALDLDLDSRVDKKQLHAPGKVVITNLEFTRDGGTFMGVPTSTVVGVLKDKDDKIEVDFVIEGDIDNPRFSLNEYFAKRVGAAFAGSIHGVEALTRKTLKETGGTHREVEGVLKQYKGVFGGTKKK